MERSQSKAKRCALTVEYDGSKFNGWQKQKGVPSVQETLEIALSRVANAKIRVVGAGRTDTGVHASGQVVHFDSPNCRSMESWLKGANTLMPESVSVLSATEVSRDFHARFSAIGRSYRYVILNRPVAPTYLWGKVTWEYREMDVGQMQRAAAYLVGEHDFNAYRTVACQSKSPIRNLRKLTVDTDGEWIWIDAEAESFLHHMIRNIVGVLTAIGAGENEPGWAKEVLEGRSRALGGVTAAPYGLYFTRASYPEQYQFPIVQACRFW